MPDTNLNIDLLSKLSIPSVAPADVRLPIWMVENAPLDVNLQYGVLGLTRMAATMKQMAAVSVQSVKRFAKFSAFKSPDSADRYAKKLCRLIKTIKFLTHITEYLAKWLSELNNFVGWIVKQIMDGVLDLASDLVQYILGWIQIIILNIKKLIISIKIKIAKFLKKILEGIKNKKGSAASAAISAAVQGLITAFQQLSKVVLMILMAIDILLNALPKIIAIDGEAMVFFMTPRSIMSSGQMKEDISCANATMSIVNRIPLPMLLALAAMFDVIPKANAVLKYSMIAAGAAAGMASVFSTFDVPDSICKALQLLDPNNVIKAIDAILQAFAMPLALPKYEQLLPTNLGFLAFLMTGFCPAGHICFGFPACP